MNNEPAFPNVDGSGRIMEELKPSERIHDITLDLLKEHPEYVNCKDVYLHIRITGLIKYLDEQAEQRSK